jgi:hypothetical protein
MHDAGPFGDHTILHLVAPFLLLKTPTNGTGFVFLWDKCRSGPLALSSLAPTKLPLKGCVEYCSGDDLIVIVRQFKLHMQTCIIRQQPFLVWKLWKIVIVIYRQGKLINFQILLGGVFEKQWFFFQFFLRRSSCMHPKIYLAFIDNSFF